MLTGEMMRQWQAGCMQNSSAGLVLGRCWASAGRVLG